MVKIYFYDDEQELETIPEKYSDFTQLVGNLFRLQEIDIFIFEYTLDDKKYFLLNQGTYTNFYNENQNAKVYIYPVYEETHHCKQENENKIEDEKEEEKEEEINNNKINIMKEENEENNNDNSNEIKLPEITHDMVIASIIKKQKEKIQQSRIKLEKERKEKEKKLKEEKKKKEKERKEKEKKLKEEKKKKEKEKPKDDFAGEISNLINNHVENFKKEIINESKIKLNQIITESQLQLKNMNANDGQDEKIIHSLEKHPNITCSKCGMNPIIGNRYCCVYCDNVNFCDKCEEEIGYEHNHPLYKFKLRVE